MQPHTRALVAAAAYAFIAGKKVAGMYDHTACRHLRIAAEARGDLLQGYDGDRDERFGGSLPELRDASNGASIYMQVDGGTAQGFDRRSSRHFTTFVSEQLVQLYEHTEGLWYSYDVQAG